MTKTPTALTSFGFEGLSVRTTTRDGEPWFVLTDVCRVLKHSNPTVAGKRLDDGDRMTLNTTDGHAGKRGGAQSITIVNESGLYSLILTSRKPEAKRFKKWITSEVLPAIRKTGGYMIAIPDETPEQLVLRTMNVLQATIDRQQAQR